MISAWELYLWTRLDFFHGGFFFVISTLVIVGVVLCIIATVTNAFGEASYKDKKDNEGNPEYPDHVAFFLGWVKARNLFVCLLLLVSLCHILIPTKKEAAMFYVIPKIATIENAELLQGEAAEIYTLAKDALKEAIGAETEPTAEAK